MEEHIFNNREEAVAFQIENNGVLFEFNNKFIVVICDGGINDV